MELGYNSCKGVIIMFTIFFAMLENKEDEPKFTQVYKKYRGMVYYIAKKHVGSLRLTEECVQEVFVAVAKNFHNIGDDINDKKVKNYIFTIAQAVSVDMYRTNAKHQYNVINQDISNINTLGEENFEFYDEMDVRSAINNLPEEYKVVIILKYVNNYSGKEIAQMCNISHTLVRQRALRAKQMMKDYLERS